MRGECPPLHPPDATLHTRARFTLSYETAGATEPAFCCCSFGAGALPFYTHRTVAATRRAASMCPLGSLLCCPTRQTGRQTALAPGLAWPALTQAEAIRGAAAVDRRVSHGPMLTTAIRGGTRQQAAGYSCAGQVGDATHPSAGAGAGGSRLAFWTFPETQCVRACCAWRINARHGCSYHSLAWLAQARSASQWPDPWPHRFVPSLHSPCGLCQFIHSFIYVSRAGTGSSCCCCCLAALGRPVGIRVGELRLTSYTVLINPALESGGSRTPTRSRRSEGGWEGGARMQC